MTEEQEDKNENLSGTAKHSFLIILAVVIGMGLAVLYMFYRSQDLDDRLLQQERTTSSLSVALDAQIEAALEEGGQVVVPNSGTIIGQPEIISVTGSDGQRGPRGLPGLDGQTPLAPADGVDGEDGASLIGPPGPPGPAGTPGVGTPGSNGEDGTDGSNGQDGANGVGADGQDGAPGAPGQDGSDGRDGEDGISPSTVYCRPPDPDSGVSECTVESPAPPVTPEPPVTTTAPPPSTTVGALGGI